MKPVFNLAVLLNFIFIFIFIFIFNISACSHYSRNANHPHTSTIQTPFSVTSSPRDYWTTSELNESNATQTHQIDEQITFQKWQGFGGTFNEAGWDALSILSNQERTRAIDLLFNTENGTAFTHARIPIGSSDYALSRYSLAEVANDYELNHFSIKRDKKLLIPFIKAAQAINPNIEFWASPWAPPTWMMEINPNEKFPNDSGTIKNDTKTLAAHALYMAKFVEAYQKKGINISAVQPQNEPGYAQHYPSCAWPNNVMRDYIANHLGPLFKARLPETEIWLGTMSNPKSDAIVQSVMSSNTASKFVKGIGLQWGMQSKAAEYKSQFDLPVMQTEHRCGNYPWVNKDQSPEELAPNDYPYALETWQLIKEWIEQGVNSYYAWNMVLDKSGMNLDEQRIWHQNALLVVDRQNKELIITPSYYVFRHLSQFIQVGATRISIDHPNALAFKNPNSSIIAILHNPNISDENSIINIRGVNYDVNIPAQGWATIRVP